MQNELAGLPLRYLIGAEHPGLGSVGVITESAFDADLVGKGIAFAYCNLLDEHVKHVYGPYLEPTDTAEEYDERVCDPDGPGFLKNLEEQFRRRKRQGFKYAELDNPDSYPIEAVLSAIQYADTFGLRVIAKNPNLLQREDAARYVKHSNVYGIIVERAAGQPADLDLLRRTVDKPDLPTWFVGFGVQGKHWTAGVAHDIKTRRFRNMSVTFSKKGEYGSSDDILLPNQGM